MTQSPLTDYKVPAHLLQMVVTTIGQMPALSLISQTPPMTVMDLLIELRKATTAQDAAQDSVAAR